MIVLDADATQKALPWPELVDALQNGFKTGCEMPVRHHHDFKIPQELDGTLFLMPAWIPGKYLAVKTADIISCATVSKTPLVKGEWLQTGSHVDLVGAFKPDMRESDDEVMRRSNIFVDTRAGALKEAGDIVQPMMEGKVSETDICADLFDLTRGGHIGRKSDDEITAFKSVGTALEDFFAATLAYENRVLKHGQ